MQKRRRMQANFTADYGNSVDEQVSHLGVAPAGAARHNDVIARRSSLEAARRGARLIEQCHSVAPTEWRGHLSRELPSAGEAASTRAAAPSAAALPRDCRSATSPVEKDQRVHAALTTLLMLGTSAVSLYDLFLFASLVVPG